MPVQNRIIEAELQTLLFRFGCQFFYGIFLIGSCVDDVVFADLAIIHRKAVVMFRGNYDVLHTRIPGDAHPLFSVKLDGVELRRKFLIVRARNVGPLHNPFTDSIGTLAVILSRRYGIEAPVNEHAESCLTPPTHALVALSLCFRHGDFCRRFVLSTFERRLCDRGTHRYKHQDACKYPLEEHDDYYSLLFGHCKSTSPTKPAAE